MDGGADGALLYAAEDGGHDPWERGCPWEYGGEGAWGLSPSGIAGLPVLGGCRCCCGCWGGSPASFLPCLVLGGPLCCSCGRPLALGGPEAAASPGRWPWEGTRTGGGGAGSVAAREAAGAGASAGGSRVRAAAAWNGVNGALVVGGGSSGHAADPSERAALGGAAADALLCGPARRLSGPLDAGAGEGAEAEAGDLDALLSGAPPAARPAGTTSAATAAATAATDPGPDEGGWNGLYPRPPGCGGAASGGAIGEREGC